MDSSLKLMLVLVLVFLSKTSEAQDVVAIGEQCGVNGADFLDDSFTGEYRVSGDVGCAIGDDTGCFCSPILGDADPTGPWIWQCLSQTPDAIPFGPAPGKTCPAEIPVSPGYAESVNPFCNSSDPTGQAGDPPCAYSTCSEGGNLTAVCGCVDLTFGQGGDNEGDFQWFCLHSTCACGPDGTDPTDAPTGAPVEAPGTDGESSAQSSFGIFSLATVLSIVLFALP